MNFKNSIFFIFVIALISCKAPEKFDYSMCRTYKITDSKQISMTENSFTLNNKTNLIELRFCTHHPSILSEIIYEEEGKWDSIIRRPKKKMGEFLLWKDISIKGINQPLYIITTSYRDAQSTIMIFDKNGNDLLSDTSKYKVYLIDFWTKKINSYDVQNSSSNFSKQYWKEVNPELYRKRFPNYN